MRKDKSENRMVQANTSTLDHDKPAKTDEKRRLILKKLAYIPPIIALIATSLAPTSVHAS